MTHSGDHPRDHRDNPLAALVSDAVSDVEPAHRLEAIRRQTRRSSLRRRRSWMYVGGGALVAAAAVVVAFTLAGGTLPETADDQPEPAQQSSEAPAAEGELVPIYFVGETARGLGLYREFQHAPAGVDPIVWATNASVTGQSDDPDYTSLWPAGTAVRMMAVGERLKVSIAGAPADLPAGMTRDEAALALQQVVYTAQAVHGEGRIGVDLLLEGEPADTILGQDTSAPLTNAPVLDTLSWVSLSTPTEGEVVTGDTLVVDGVANSFEANVPVTLQQYDGGEVVLEDFFTASGTMGTQLYPFGGELDVSDVPPGEYLLVVATEDPSGGEEGFGPDTDSRRVTIE
jgi:hypothetical protein